MSKFAVFDIDGTLFRGQLFHEVAFELMESGHIPEAARKHVDKKLNEWRARERRHAFKEYEHALAHAFLEHLPGLKVSELEKAVDKVLERSSAQVYTYTRDVADKLRRQGYTLIAISGSQHEIIERFTKIWHFDLAFGQVHTIKDGIYTEAPKDDELIVANKGSFLKRIVKEHNLSWDDSYAIGDSLSDAKMLELVAHPIAFNPDEPLFKVAKTHGWCIVIERKNMAYELEQRDGSYILAQTNAE